MGKLFLKNFYYSRESVLKLIYLYNYLNNISFLDELNLKITKSQFSPEEKKTDLLSSISLNLLSNVLKLELAFGYVWMFDDKFVIYFKPNFDFSDFSSFFFNLEVNYNIKLAYLEFFFKKIKILEIFLKTSLLRNFRGEKLVSLKKKIIGIRESYIDCQDKDFLFFITKYEPKNIKMVVYFSKLEY